MNDKNRIRYFPISFFSVILGMAGLTIAYQKVEHILKMPFNLSNYILLFTLVSFVIISSTYLVKLIKFKEEVKAEFNHPIKLSFFPAFSISLVLLGVAFTPINMLIAKYFLVVGVALHFILTIKIVSIWIQHDKFKIVHMSPAWFIPAVGNILVPIAGIDYFLPEISWFFFSIGFLFWVILLVIFFNRIIFHDPLPDKLLPTLFILIAPPSIGFVSLVKLTGEISIFSKMLYYMGLFLACLVFAQIKMFKKIKYYLSWWAYSFPVAAITIASILMFHETNIDIFKYISLSFFGVLHLIVILLLFKTGTAIVKNEICVEEK